MADEAVFSAQVHSGHKEHAVEVPFDPGERWGLAAQPLGPGRRGFRVRATLGGGTFETAIVSRSQRYWLLLPAAVEQAAGVSAGDTVTVSVGPTPA